MSKLNFGLSRPVMHTLVAAMVISAWLIGGWALHFIPVYVLAVLWVAVSAWDYRERKGSKPERPRP